MRKAFIFFGFVLTTLLMNSCAKQESGNENKVEEELVTPFSVLNVTASSVTKIKYDPDLLSPTQTRSIGLENASSIEAAVDKNNIYNFTVLAKDQTYAMTLLLLNEPSNKTGKSSLVIYQANSKKLYAISRMSVKEDGMKHFELTDLEGNVYYSFDANKDNKMGNFSIERSVPIREITRNVSANSSNNEYFTETVCHGPNVPWADCMLCEYNDCLNNWSCILVYGTTAIGHVAFNALVAYACS